MALLWKLEGTEPGSPRKNYPSCTIAANTRAIIRDFPRPLQPLFNILLLPMQATRAAIQGTTRDSAGACRMLRAILRLPKARSAYDAYDTNFCWHITGIRSCLPGTKHAESPQLWPLRLRSPEPWDRNVPHMQQSTGIHSKIPQMRQITAARSPQ